MRVLSVNVTEPRTVVVKGKQLRTSIFKRASSARVRIDRLGLEGEQRVSDRMCAAEDHALYMYPFEHYAHWHRELGVSGFPYGQFGENLTVQGLHEGSIRIGDVLRCGSTVLEVRQPRLPCRKLDARMGMRFAGRFLRSRRLGFFLRVVEPGTIAPGDAIEMLASDPAEPTVDELIRLSQIDYWDAVGLEGLLQSRKLPEAWSESVRTKLARARAARGWHGSRALEVDDREHADGRTVSLWLRCPYGRPLATFEAGQYLTVEWRAPDGVKRRAYAITSPPEERTRYRITVRRVTGSGGVSSALIDDVPVGAQLRVTAPRGQFVLQGTEPRELLFVSDAAGAASVVPLIRQWSRLPDRAPACYAHAGAWRELPLHGELDRVLRGPSPLRRLLLQPVMDDAGPSSRMAAELRRALARVGDAYLAGESRFVDGIARLMEDSGVRVHCERYGRAAD